MLARLAKIDVLILDDFLLAPVTDVERRDLLEVLEDRYGKRSTVLTSQLPTKSWHVGNDPVNVTDSSGLAPKDKLWGLPKRFWRWYHRNFKRPGDPDLGKEEARALCDEWEQMGKPGPDKKGANNVIDDLDSFMPGPIYPDFCRILPPGLFPFCHEEA